jgi:hypothetical protein
MEQQLRSTRYFADIPDAGAMVNAPVDIHHSMDLWRRACTDPSFDEVRRSLAGYHPFVPASYFDGAPKRPRR